MAAAEYPRPYGDYVLLERLGVGGMSQIDLARKAIEDADFVRFCVIKRIKAERTEDEAFVRMFKDEARITAELSHANIAHVYDFGREGDEYYLVLEYVPGLDLRRVVNGLRRRGDRVPLRIGLKILGDVLDGLGYAHDKVDSLGRPMNVVHRDVNPRNIMISVRGEVKLIDFGVAKATNRLERTRTDHVKGKFAYMAPEQVSADEVDRRADLFAAGLVLHEIVTGYGPFEGLSQVQIMHKLVSGGLPDLPPPPELADPKPLLAVHRKALAMSPDDRYQTAADFKAALVEVAAPLGGLASQADVAALVAHVDPRLTERLREKAESYSGLRPSQVATAPMPVLPAIGEPPPPEISLSDSRSVSRGQMVAGGMALGAGFAAFAGLVVVVVAAVLLYRSPWNPWTSSPAADPTITAVGVGEDQPDPLESTQSGAGVTVETLPAPEGTPDAGPAPHVVPAPDVAPAPASAPEPAAPAPVPRPTSHAAPVPAPTTTASPAPAPEPAPSGTAEPSPAPTPAPIVVRVPAPEPKPGTADEPIVLKAPPAPTPTPAPVAVATGTLQVTSATRGSPILVDGKATDYVTPAEFPWPAGRFTVSVGELSREVTVRPDMRTTVILR